MKNLGNTSLTKLFSLIKTYVRDSINATKPSDIGAAAESHSHSPASYSTSGFMTVSDKKAIQLVSPIRAISMNGYGYIADIPLLSFSSLAVGTSFIMVPEKTSTGINCTLNFCGTGSKPIRVHTANNNGVADLPTHAAWLTQYKPVRMTYNGTYWVADVVNAAAKQMVVPVILTVAGWNASTKRQVATVTGVLADYSKQKIEMAFSSEAAILAYAEAGILAVAQGAGTLTFQCSTVPTEAIAVNIIIQPL